MPTHTQTSCSRWFRIATDNQSPISHILSLCLCVCPVSPRVVLHGCVCGIGLCLKVFVRVTRVCEEKCASCVRCESSCPVLSCPLLSCPDQTGPDCLCVCQLILSALSALHLWCKRGQTRKKRCKCESKGSTRSTTKACPVTARYLNPPQNDGNRAIENGAARARAKRGPKQIVRRYVQRKTSHDKQHLRRSSATPAAGIVRGTWTTLTTS